MAEDTKPQQILFVIRYFHPFIGGLEKKVFNLARSLSACGYSITVITSRFSLAWRSEELLDCGMRIIRLPSPRVKVAGACIYLAALSLYLWRHRSAFDIIHSFQVGYSSSCAVMAGHLLGKKTVITLSSSGSGGDVLRHRSSPWGRIFLHCCLKASSIVTLHKAMQSEVTEVQPVRSMQSIPNGVDTARYHPSPDRSSLRLKLGIAPHDRLILYAGRLSAEKGLDFLLKSFSTLQPAASLRLWLFGDGPEHSALSARIDELELRDRVTLHAATDTVAPLLQAADLFIMPSKFEGMSNSLLEAMACGLPVIATDVAGNRELIEPEATGLLVPFGDTAALADAISTLLDNPGLAGRLGENARNKIAGRYGIEHAVELHRQLYAGLGTCDAATEAPA